MGKVGSSPAFRRNGRQNPHPPKEPSADDNGVLTPEELDALEECASGEDVARLVSHEAMATIIQIMRRPGRHAQTQLAAARELIAYGVSKPAQKVENKLEGTLALQMTVAETLRAKRAERLRAMSNAPE